MKIIKVDLPEYNIKSDKLDYDGLGVKVDKAITDNFPNGNYILRVIGSGEHPNITRSELVAKIIELGTDKYDPNRIAVAHGQFKHYDYDIQASTFEIKNGKITYDESYTEYPCKTVFGCAIYDFLVNTPFDRGYSVRVDILLIYDIDKLELATKKENIKDPFKKGLEQYLYKFKNPKDKKSALLGLVEVT